jgi:hypothetical protein
VSFQFVEHPFLAGVRAPRVRVRERSVSQEA